MSAIMNYVEDKHTSEFYPTPEYLVKKMIEGVDWRFVETVLEPSAGKGDILRTVAKKLHYHKSPEIDCIELDNNLRQILKYNFSDEAKEVIFAKKRAITEKYSKYVERAWDTQKYQYFDSEKRKRVNVSDKDQTELDRLDEELEGFFDKDICIVHDDFMTYEAYKQYDLIIMNPPFSCGDKHLLKALDIQKNGGNIICLLNAETIRNPYTESRKHLVRLLDEYNADIEYINDAFSDAERTAKVDVALIKVCIPENDNEMSLFERLAESKEYYEEMLLEEPTELEVSDFIKAIVNRYKVEIESGIELIKTYNRMLPYLNTSFSTKEYGYSKPIIELTDGNSHEMTINRYVKAVRLKYWKELLTNEKFIGKLTSKLQHEYREKVCSFSNYDFSEFNIQTLAVEMNNQVKTGIESEIMTMYDRLTEEHSFYPECTKNRHLYDGWKTNKAWKLDKKSIIPCYGIFDRWDGKPRKYEAYGLLADIERILNFFDGNMTAEIDLSRQLELNFNNGITKNIQCKFFNVTFYKKGTVHITFTCPELIDRFNIYAAQNKKWLPPSYGKKLYKDMTDEEKAVIDSFQGEKAYNKVLERTDYYLASPTGNTRQFLAIAG